jgi:hypothetical protein
MTLISTCGCSKCQETVEQAAWSVASSAVLSCIRRLLRGEVDRGQLFEQAVLLGGASREPGKGGSFTTSAQQGAPGTKSNTAAKSAASDVVSGRALALLLCGFNASINVSASGTQQECSSAPRERSMSIYSA